MRGILILAFSCFCSQAFAQHTESQLDSLFNKLYTEGKFNGNVLVAEKGQVLYQRSFGMASLDQKRPLNKESIFELASVSKQFTAMGIMILKKKGALSYEDSLRKFFPELPYEQITIRHLLNHTSGLPDYMELFEEYWDSSKIATNRDMIGLLAQYKPKILFNPGEKYEYSNTGYALLASIIEKASGKSYGKFLDEAIFKPLKMSNTLVLSRRFDNKVPENYAYGYVKQKTDSTFILPDEHPDYKAFVKALDGIQGDGTVNSTTGDLFLWDRALHDQALLTQEEWFEALQTPVLKNGKKSFYGFGWMVDSSKTFGRIMNHSGSWPGYNTFIERHTDNDKTFILLSNMERGSLPYIAIRRILYHLQNNQPQPAIKLSADSLKQYKGKYTLAPDFVLTIWVENEKLLAQATGQTSFILTPEKTDWFIIPEVSAKIQFIRNDTGLVRSLVLYQNGQEVPGEKTE